MKKYIKKYVEKELNFKTFERAVKPLGFISTRGLFVGKSGIKIPAFAGYIKKNLKDKLGPKMKVKTLILENSINPKASQQTLKI